MSHTLTLSAWCLRSRDLEAHGHAAPALVGPFAWDLQTRPAGSVVGPALFRTKREAKAAGPLCRYRVHAVPVTVSVEVLGSESAAKLLPGRRS